jgi:hypothetical protein
VATLRPEAAKGMRSHCVRADGPVARPFGVDVDEALAALPVLYGRALRMDAAGDGVDAIAAALTLDVSVVPALLEIGRRKLGSLLEDG